MDLPTPSIEIFRAGRHTAESGFVRDYTAADLADLAASYDRNRHEAPVVIGHPTHNAPAYGWVRSLRADGDILRADLDQVDPAFADLVREGRYKKRSISLYLPDSPGNPLPGQFYLRHVGFLGAQPPAVKGLRDVAFQDDAAALTLEFSDDDDRWAWSSLADILRRLREWLIDDRDLETADRLIPEYAITAATAAATDTESPPSTESTESTFQEPQEKPVPEPTPDYAARQADLTAQEAALAALASDLAAREAALIAAEVTRLRQEATDFADAQVSAGRVLPRQRSGLIETLLAVGPLTLEFTENDQPVKTGGAAWLRQFISELPVQVDYTERTARTGGATVDLRDPQNTAARALDFFQRRQALGRPVSYTEAVDAVLHGKDQ